MANKIEETSISAANYVDFTSRYVKSRVIYYGDSNILAFKTYKRTDPVFAKDDKFYLINAATQYRPDIVAKLAYGIPSYWWKLMEANRIYDIYDFKQGVTIRIPTVLF